MSQFGGPRWLNCQRSRLAGESIVTHAVDALAANGPKLVAQMLLDERDFGLHRDFDIGQRGFLAAVGRDAGENPRRAFLVHQPARAVDRVDDDAPAGIVLLRAFGEHDAAVRQSFADQNDWFVRRNFAIEPFDERRFADPVDRVDDVARAFVRDARSVHRPSALRTPPRPARESNRAGGEAVR